MPRKKKKKAPANGLHFWEYAESAESYSRTGDLMKAPQLQALPPAVRWLYMAMVNHKAKPEQRQNLYRALRDMAFYGQLDNHDMKILKESGEISEVDLEAKCNDPSFPYFVFPMAVADEYGISRGHFSEQVKQLEKAGFISIYRQGIGGYGNAVQISVYRFSDSWKKSEKIKNTITQTVTAPITQTVTVTPESDPQKPPVSHHPEGDNLYISPGFPRTETGTALEEPAEQGEAVDKSKSESEFSTSDRATTEAEPPQERELTIAELLEEVAGDLDLTGTERLYLRDRVKNDILENREVDRDIIWELARAIKSSRP